MSVARWSAATLDEMRTQGDPLADECLGSILHADEAGVVRSLFRQMNANDDIPPATVFPGLASFFEQTNALPPGIDQERIHRGEHVFIRNVYLAALALLTKSLPEGYAAPSLSIILNISGELRTHTFRRLLATLQTVINVSSCHGFQHGGRAVITAQKLRLLHAGIRHLTRKYRPAYETLYGVPVNQEDMLGTIMGFSLLVLRGLRTLGAGLSRQEEDDFLYLWLAFARMMGVYPHANPDDVSYIPADVDDAEVFYGLYEQRHYVDAARNPDGVALGQANLAMLEQMIPFPFRYLGFRPMPNICMEEMMGPAGVARIAIAPLKGHSLLRWILRHLHGLMRPYMSIAPLIDGHLGMGLLQYLINTTYGGEVTFSVPVDLKELKEIDSH